MPPETMYISKQQAPPEFMKRYEAIISGREKLDTVAKLKDFWLFAVEQGWKSYDMREYVAELTVKIMNEHTGSLKKLLTWPSELWLVFDLFEAAQLLNSDSFEEGTTSEKIADDAWTMLQHVIEDVDSTVS